MKNISMSILALSTALTFGPVFANNCEIEMKTIDEAMLGSSLSLTDLDRVKSLREQGAELNSTGDLDGCINVLKEAKDLLGL